jgi:hypothetical protein
MSSVSCFPLSSAATLTGLLAASETFANNTLVLTDGVGDQARLNIEGSFADGAIQISDDGTGGTDVVICFAAGTLIATPAGEVPVDKLQAGELVMAAHNGLRPVRWIGKGKVLATRGRRTAATPVIVRKRALSPNLPHTDLRVAKAHSLYIDEVLTSVEFLVRAPQCRRNLGSPATRAAWARRGGVSQSNRVSGSCWSMRITNG